MEYRIGTLSEGLAGSGRLRAICECGWKGPWRPGLGPSIAAANEDLEEHAAGHKGVVVREPFYISSARGIAYHRACGHHHSLADDCPLPPDSPAGLLRRMLGPSTSEPARALSRLRSAVALSNLVQGEGMSAVIGARLAGAGWDELEEACAALDLELAEWWLDPARRLESARLALAGDGGSSQAVPGAK